MLKISLYRGDALGLPQPVIHDLLNRYNLNVCDIQQMINKDQLLVVADVDKTGRATEWVALSFPYQDNFSVLVSDTVDDVTIKHVKLLIERTYIGTGQVVDWLLS